MHAFNLEELISIHIVHLVKVGHKFPKAPYVYHGMFKSQSHPIQPYLNEENTNKTLCIVIRKNAIYDVESILSLPQMF